METNAKIIAIAVLIATSAISTSNAQNQPGPGDSPTPQLQAPNALPLTLAGPGKQHKRPAAEQIGPNDEQAPGRKVNRGLTTLTTLTGTVGQWVGNDDAILDGFTINTGSSTTTVKFPPHLGQQVQKAVKPGSSISVTGYSETGPQSNANFRMNSLTSGKTTVTDAPPTPQTTTPETPTLTTVSGKILDYRLNRAGRVSGLVLDDKTVVTIPPHVAYQLTDLAKKGSAVTVQGYPKSVRDGQVQLEKVNILRASVLTIGGQQYLIR